jgi:hypothetical protein
MAYLRECFPSRAGGVSAGTQTAAYPPDPDHDPGAATSTAISNPTTPPDRDPVPELVRARNPDSWR